VRGEGTLYSETCGECRGEGYVRNEATLTVEVPAGIQEGQTLRMEGEGAPSPEGGPHGDLLIDVSIREHEEFEREGDDLQYRLPISFPTGHLRRHRRSADARGRCRIRDPEGDPERRDLPPRGEGYAPASRSRTG